jgi:ABC-type transporter Mla MlaB component
MLRITPTKSSDHYIILRLEGRIAGPWVTELWNACEEALSEGKTLELNLAEVSFLDNAGVSLLTKIRARGIALANCSPFVAEQLKDAG